MGITYRTVDEIQAPPIIGTIGDASIERCFCRIIHQAIRGELTYKICPSEDCGHLLASKCGLTGHRYPCLFSQLDDPDWELIRLSPKP